MWFCGLLARQPVADGADHRHRLRRRRCDRDDREHRAPHGGGRDRRCDAALRGAREIGFTVISLTLSLIAVFIPLLFMTGLVGRMFREFALTLTIAVVVSAIVSLTLTPMMCAKLLRHGGTRRRQPGHALASTAWSTASSQATAAASNGCCATRRLTLLVTAADAGRHDLALRRRAEGLPAAAGHRPDHRRDRGRAPRSRSPRCSGCRSWSPTRCAQDPDVTGVVSVVGVSPLNATPNAGRLKITLQAARRAQGAWSTEIIDRLQARGRRHPRHDGLLPAGAGHPDLRRARAARSTSTRWSRTDAAEVAHVVGPAGRGAARQRRRCATCRPRRRRAACARCVKVDREKAGRLGVSMQVDQRHAQRRVRPAPDLHHLRPGEPVPRGARGRAAVPARSVGAAKIYVPANIPSQPLRPRARRTSSRSRPSCPAHRARRCRSRAFAEMIRTTAPLAIAHQEQFPSVTISFNLAPGAALGDAVGDHRVGRARRSACRRR